MADDKKAIEDTGANIEDPTQVEESEIQDVIEDTDADTSDLSEEIAELSRKIDAMNSAIARLIADKPVQSDPVDTDNDGVVTIDELDFD